MTTEKLLHTLEEKMMLLLTELEDKRKELESAHQQVSKFMSERQTYEKKITGLIELLDTVNDTMSSTVPLPELKPVLVQG